MEYLFEFVAYIASNTDRWGIWIRKFRMILLQFHQFFHHLIILEITDFGLRKNIVTVVMKVESFS